MSRIQNPGRPLCYKVMNALSNRRKIIATKL
jgi:hypothetical protein